ncbi:hypothetical protein [Sphaerisporangium sp. TRM90804]|uniref:hypothetical protein n=1 Tax=Sphaerisporangium sp. TRM90804 TaxID=3031113 RepID=UPI002447836C|nr:hypothetical protein [Sphaerisporangium sp. TRM90804]MDH2424547.1 hypothetical protein [Sphaerisporangium sp. TRM90804]
MTDMDETQNEQPGARGRERRARATGRPGEDVWQQVLREASGTEPETSGGKPEAGGAKPEASGGEPAAGSEGRAARAAAPPVDREQWFRQRDRERQAEASGEPAADPLGSAVDEARRLFDSVQQRVGREIGKGVVKGGVAGLGHGVGQVLGGRARGDVWGEAVRHDDEYICRACPVCRLKAARRDGGGDVSDHLLAAGGELLAAFRQAVEAVSRPAPPRSSGDTDTRVQHIDLG